METAIIVLLTLALLWLLTLELRHNSLRDLISDSEELAANLYRDANREIGNMVSEARAKIEQAAAKVRK